MPAPDLNIETLQTDRLLLRPMVVGDAGVIAAMQMDPAVMEHYGDGQPLTREQADETVLKYHVRCREYDYWAWAVTSCETGDVLGQVTAGWEDLDGQRAICLGFILRKSAWGLGYGPEAVAAVVGHGQQQLGWLRVWAGVSPLNVRSCRLCEKAGLIFLREELNPRGLVRRLYVAAVV